MSEILIRQLFDPVNNRKKGINALSELLENFDDERNRGGRRRGGRGRRGRGGRGRPRGRGGRRERVRRPEKGKFFLSKVPIFDNSRQIPTKYPQFMIKQSFVLG